MDNYLACRKVKKKLQLELNTVVSSFFSLLWHQTCKCWNIDSLEKVLIKYANIPFVNSRPRLISINARGIMRLSFKGLMTCSYEIHKIERSNAWWL